MIASGLADLGQLLVGVAAVITAIALIHGQRTLTRKVDGVHAEVKTANGITLAALADRTEGRRIEENVAPADRTESEAGYVDILQEGGRDVGHEDTTKEK